MTARRVLVTGGARGIGRAVCEAFAAQGDRVAVHASRGASRGEPGAVAYAAAEAGQACWSTGAVLDVNGASCLRS